MPTGAQYSPAEVYAIVNDVFVKRTGYNNPSLGVLRATYVVLRESGGNAQAFRPASENPNGGNDRGWWQFNDKYFPDVSDMVAFDPVQSTQKAFDVSKGFTDFGPWKTSRDPNWGLTGSKHQRDAFKAALAAFLGDDGKVTITTGHNQYSGPFQDTTGVASIRDLYQAFAIPNYDKANWLDAVEVIIDNPVDLTVGAVKELAPDWMEALAKLLGNLLDPGWWKRVGIGALALAIILISLALYFRQQATTPKGTS